MSDMMDLDDIINKYSTKQPENDKISDNDNEINSAIDYADERKRRIAEALSRSVSRIVEEEELENTEKASDKNKDNIKSEPQDASSKKTAEKSASAKPKSDAEAKKPSKSPSVTEIISFDNKKTESAAEKLKPAKDKPSKSGEPSADFEKPKAKAPSKKDAPEKTSIASKAQKPVSIEKLLMQKDEEERRKKAKEKTKAVAVINKEPFLQSILKYRFLFEELAKRDFKKKYKRAALGVLWSVISPFLMFLTQYLVFSYLFQRNINNFPIYLLTGNLMFSFFSSATTSGMFSMYSNGGIISKVKAPKILFLLSSNVASLFNFALTMVVYFGFLIFNNITFGPHMLLMLFPIICLIIFNIGVSLVLASLFVFFRDTQYLYQIFTTVLMYFSAIFYSVSAFPENFRFVFQLNPVYKYIEYMRIIVIDTSIPSLKDHLMCLGYALAMLLIGYVVHKKTESKFLYYF